MRRIFQRVIFGVTTFAIPPTVEVMASLIRAGADVIAKEQKDWTLSARQIAIAIAKFESYLGGAGNFAPDGVPSWNWGAVRARADTDSFSFSNGSKWAKFANMTEGFLYWKKIMPTAAIEAMQKGDAKAVAAAMYTAGYFGKEEYVNYEAAIVAQSKIVAHTLGEPELVSGNSTVIGPSNSGNGYIALAAGLTTAGLIWYASKSAS